MKRLLAILTALLLCFPFLSVGGPRALADGNDCFLSASFPSVYNQVLKRDFLTVLTQDPSAGDLQLFPYQLMFRSQTGASELYATSDGLVRLSFEYDSPDEAGLFSQPASALVFAIPFDYDSLKQNAYMLSLIRALHQADPAFNESTATMLMLTAGPSPVTVDVSMGQMTAQLQDGEYIVTLTRSGAASPYAPEVSDDGGAADLPEVTEPPQDNLFEPVATDPPAAPAPAGDSASSGSFSVLAPGSVIMSASGVEMVFREISHVVFDGEVDLKVKYSVTNRSGSEIVLNMGDTFVNGVRANTVGISILKDGESAEDQMYIEPVDSASQQAICNPSSLSVALSLQERDYRQELADGALNMAVSLPSVTPMPGSKFSFDSVPTPVPQASSSSVSRPLAFPDNANGQWEYVGSDQLRFRCQVQNVSGSDSISAFELYLYPTDAWGNRLIGADEVYYHTTSRQIHPGQTAYSDYFTIGDRNNTANVYVGIKRVILTDGTVYDYDDVEYWSWTIK